jgi:KDO2-lipid IV(A) lauroyltransferase
MAMPEKRANIERNLAVMLNGTAGGPTADVRRKVRRLARRSMAAYGRVLVDFLAFEALLPGASRDTGLTPGFDQLENLIASGRGAVFATPHFGHWDMAGAVLAQRFPGKIAAVAERFENPHIDKLVVGQREECGLEVVPMENVRQMTRVLREGRVLGILADRPVTGDEGVPVRFFGHQANLPAGAATLALLARCPIMVGSLHRRDDGRFEGFIMPPIEPVRTGNREADVAATMQLVADQLEAVIRRSPHQWYMFRNMWPDALKGAPLRPRKSRRELALVPAIVGSMALANAIRVRRTGGARGPARRRTIEAAGATT